MITEAEQGEGNIRMRESVSDIAFTPAVKAIQSSQKTQKRSSS
jgi:hypothetical protein